MFEEKINFGDGFNPSEAEKLWVSTKSEAEGNGLSVILMFIPFPSASFLLKTEMATGWIWRAVWPTASLKLKL